MFEKFLSVFIPSLQKWVWVLGCVLLGFGFFHQGWWLRGFPGGLVVKNPPANAGDTGDADLIPGSGRSPGEGNSNSPQYSCLGNPMDRGAWWATVHWVTKELNMAEWLNKNKKSLVLLALWTFGRGKLLVLTLGLNLMLLRSMHKFAVY